MDPSIALADWKEVARAGKAPAGVAFQKVYVADVIKSEGDGKSYTFTISTGAVDRDHDTLKVDGWQTDNWIKAGGPVLYAHRRQELPIGKAPWARATGGALKARMEFAPADVYPFADTVRKLVDFGALKSTSVGFLPIENAYAWNDERGGIDFAKQELLEFSIVPVPANPQALLDAKAAGIDVAPVKAWAEGVLDGLDPGFWVPKAQALAAYKVLAEPKVAGFDPAPFLAEFAKRGRVLSTANESRIRSASDAAAAISASLDAVLEQVAEEPEKVPVPVLYLAPSEPIFSVSVGDIRAAVVAAVSDSVRAAVSHERGRID